MYPPIDPISYDEMRKLAAEFSKAHWPSGELPVKIDDIAELGIGLRLIPIPGLKRLHGIEGYLSADFTCICVDAGYFDEEGNRSRFTLAHELGHYQLHRELVEALDNRDVGSFRHPAYLLKPEQYSRYEQQANNFAGLVLVPPKQLAREVKSASDLKTLARAFRVSWHVIDIRGKRDEHWYV